MPERPHFIFCSANTALTGGLAKVLRTAFPDSVSATVAGGEELLERLRAFPTAVLFCDGELGPELSLAELARIRALDGRLRGIRFFVFSDFPPDALEMAASSASVFRFLPFSTSEAELITAVRAILGVVAPANEFAPLSLARGDALFRTGDRSDHAYLLKSGRLGVFKKGLEVALGDVRPGEFVGEMAFITGDPRSADVVALEDSTLVAIGREALDLLFVSKPDWARALLRTFARRIRDMNERTR